jgi:hypothetical protein
MDVCNQLDWDYSRAMINCYWNASMFSLLEDIKKFIRIVDKQWILEIGAHSLIESTQRVYGVGYFLFLQEQIKDIIIIMVQLPTRQADSDGALLSADQVSKTEQGTGSTLR